jgi:hypothetical protein
MKSSEPPQLATWLLERLTPGNKNEGLAGDLVEEFKQGRSVAWYWRQVLGAIGVRFANQLRGQGGAMGFAIVWTCAAALLWPSIRSGSQLDFLIGWGSVHGRPQSLLYVTAIDVAAMTPILWLGVILYLALTRSFDLKRLFSGLLIGSLGLLAITVSPLLFRWLPHDLWRFRYGVGLPTPRWDNYKREWGPFFVALLVSIWTGRPSLVGRSPKKISA